MGGGASRAPSEGGDEPRILPQWLRDILNRQKKEDEEPVFFDAEGATAAATEAQMKVFLDWFKQHTPGIIARKMDRIYATRLYNQRLSGVERVAKKIKLDGGKTPYDARYLLALGFVEEDALEFVRALRKVGLLPPKDEEVAAAEGGGEESAQVLPNVKVDANWRDKDAKSVLDADANTKPDKPVATATTGRALYDFAKNDRELDVESMCEDFKSNSLVLDWRDDNGFTAANIACYSGTAGCLEKIINAGCALNLGNNDGQTPAFTAAKMGHHACLKLLIEAKADLKQQSLIGVSPVYVAAASGKADTLKLLTSKSLVRDGLVDINAANNAGGTPIGICVVNSQEKCLEILIRAGADVNKRTASSKSPLGIALQMGRTKIVDILRKHNAEE